MSHPFFGKEFNFTQPDGTDLRVRGWGDQYYAVFEALNGYTVEQNAATGFYEYADLSKDGLKLLPTGGRPRVVKPSELGLSPRIRISREAARVQVQDNRNLSMGHSRWEERGKELEPMALAPAMLPPAAIAHAAFSPNVFAPAEARSVSAATPVSLGHSGHFVGLCLLIEFPDRPATISRQEVDDFCNKPGYNGFGNNGSVYDYFYDVSGGRIKYNNIVTPYYMAKNPSSHYMDVQPDSTMTSRQLIAEALEHFVATGLDLSRLTVDNQSYVYAVNAFYSGFARNNKSGLWPHHSGMNPVFWLPGGARVKDYQISNMGTSLELGTFCHENGHMLCSFNDLYDPNESNGVGRFCLMGAGGHGHNPSHVCAYLKAKAGWVTSMTPIFSGSGMTLTAHAGRNEFFIYRRNDSEYFIIENRLRQGRDLNLPGSGLAIWHVDERGNNQNSERLPGLHYECTLIQADGRHDLENRFGNDGDMTDLFRSGVNNSFGPATTPGSHWWDGSPSGLDIRNISTAGTVMTFTVG
ncbi:MAG: M6 family metalloprotease domain-containing protein [Candidatus Methylacidiphilales bacterium]|nr:M6 family metalloprotease domain-containing protein [Candidatus Methylacidiphilales bacterium]